MDGVCFLHQENVSGKHDCRCEKGYFLNQLRSKISLFHFFGKSSIFKKDTFFESVYKGMGESGRDHQEGEGNVSSATRELHKLHLGRLALGASHFHP